MSFPMAHDEIEILYEDNALLVVNKPAGMLTQSDKTGDRTIIEPARRHIIGARGESGGNPFVVPVHRLDRPTSGVLILARKTKVASRLGEQFRENLVQKTYWGLVEGRPPERRMELEHWLLKDRDANRTSVVPADTPGAVPAELSCRVLEKLGGRTMLEVRPVTGRSHQIRVQLAEIGCPIVGDMRYGSKKALGHMIALHCRSLSFTHPITEGKVHVVAELPEEWKSVLKAES